MAWLCISRRSKTVFAPSVWLQRHVKIALIICLGLLGLEAAMLPLLFVLSVIPSPPARHPATRAQDTGVLLEEMDKLYVCHLLSVFCVLAVIPADHGTMTFGSTPVLKRMIYQ